MPRLLISTFILLIAFLPTVAFAHDGPHYYSMRTGLLYGFTHPLFGVDHLLAMLCVGVIWRHHLFERFLGLSTE